MNGYENSSSPQPSAGNAHVRTRAARPEATAGSPIVSSSMLVRVTTPAALT